MKTINNPAENHGPFKVPDQFFEQMESHLLGQLPKKKSHKLLYWSAGIAASLLLVAGTFLLTREKPLPGDSVKLEVLYTWTPEMTTEELLEVTELIDNDIFLNLE